MTDEKKNGAEGWSSCLRELKELQELVESHFEGLRAQMEDEMTPDDGERVMEYWSEEDGYGIRIIYRYEITSLSGCFPDDDEGMTVTRLRTRAPHEVFCQLTLSDGNPVSLPSRLLVWLEAELGRIFRDRIDDLDIE